ncbi:MAG: sel1 repeat family protein [Bacteroidales bacterium]|nr:sel1 repeat family protein [Bacteroidales bacterium]
MKRFLLIFATALFIASCGQKDNNEQEQPKDKEVYIPQGVPVAPMQEIQIQEKGEALGDPNGPVLKLEEGKPLDFNQLQGGGMSVGDQVAAQIDSIRYKAEHGDAKYQYAYGVCYEKGWGVEKDLKQALTWYNKAAAQNNGPAYNSLGNFYREGSGVKADPKKAFEYYQNGAAEKDAQAMLNLGNCYFYGMGVEKDEKTAVKWWKDAADAGNVYAISQIGDCYLYGIGTEKDLTKAVEYLSQAADHNIANAQYRLGILYYTGDGVEQDRTYAELLMRKAQNGGMKEAQDFLEKNFKK